MLEESILRSREGELTVDFKTRISMKVCIWPRSILRDFTPVGIATLDSNMSLVLSEVLINKHSHQPNARNVPSEQDAYPTRQNVQTAQSASQWSNPAL